MKVLRRYLPLVLAIFLLFTNSSISATSRWFSWSAITSIFGKRENKALLTFLVPAVAMIFGYVYFWRSKKNQTNNLDNTYDTDNYGNGSDNSDNTDVTDNIKQQEEQYLKDIEQFCDNEKYLSKKVSVGKSIVDGREYELTKNITIKQLLVLNQNQRDKEGISTGGGPDSCAYHAVKNAEAVVNSVSNLSICLLGNQYSRERFATVEEKKTGYWRSYVIDWRDIENVKKFFAQKINNVIDYTFEIDSDNIREFQKNSYILRLKTIVDNIAETLARGLVKNVTDKFTLTSDKIKVFVQAQLGSTELDKAIKVLITNGHIQFGKEIKQIDFSNSILVIDPKKEIKKNGIKSDLIKRKGASLERHEIVCLVEKKQKSGEWPKGVGYSVIEDVSRLDCHEAFLDEQDKKMIKEFDLVKQWLEKDQQFMHVFFISTSGHMESGKEKQLQGTYGHWLSLVYSLQGKKRVCIVADSKNIIRLYKDPWVKKIIEKLEGKEVAQNFKLTNKNELQRMETGIERLIAGYDKTSKNRDAVKNNLLTLSNRYQTWSGMKLPDDKIKKIEDIIID